MGGIVITVKTSHGKREWSGHAEDVSNFFNRKNIGAVVAPAEGDSHNGTITIDAERQTIILDTDYFTPSKETIRFWNCLGFEVLGKLKGEGS